MDIPYFLFLSCWTLALLLSVAYYEECCQEHGCTSVCSSLLSIFLSIYLGVELWSHMRILYLIFSRSTRLFSKMIIWNAMSSLFLARFIHFWSIHASQSVWNLWLIPGILNEFNSTFVFWLLLKRAEFLSLPFHVPQHLLNLKR